MQKVLVVDDDKVLQQSVKEALEFHDFNVSVADYGKEAVQAVYRDEYDLVEELATAMETGADGTTDVKDVDDGIALCQWTQTSGPPVDLSSAAVFNPTFIAPEPGPEGVHVAFSPSISVISPATASSIYVW